MMTGVRAVAGTWLDRLAAWAWLPVIVQGLLLMPAWPWDTWWAFDHDEGLNMMKARLVADGVPLYTAIWSDQPPIYTWYLAQWVKLGDRLWPGQPVWTLWAARATSLMLVAAMATLIYKLARRHVGIAAAAIGAAFFWCGYMVAHTSGSVLVGTPAVALALAAVAAAAWAVDRRSLGLAVIGGGLMGLSLLCKVLMLPLVAVVPGWLIWQKRYVAAAGFVGGGLLVFGGLGWWSGFFDGVAQMADAGLGAATRTEFSKKSALDEIGKYFARTLPATVLAIAGGVWAMRRGINTAWLVAAWFWAMFLLILLHRPVWYHHFLTLTVPLSWQASYGAERLLTWVRAEHRRWRVPAVLGLLTVAVVNPLRLSPHLIREREGRPVPPARIAALREAGGSAVFSDELIHAYLADRRVPAALAVVSQKRLTAGLITGDDVRQAFTEADVAAASFTRFEPAEFGEDFERWLAEKYEVRLLNDGTVLHVRRSE
jgi:hypothetical protein